MSSGSSHSADGDQLQANKLSFMIIENTIKNTHIRIHTFILAFTFQRIGRISWAFWHLNATTATTFGCNNSWFESNTREWSATVGRALLDSFIHSLDSLAGHVLRLMCWRWSPVGPPLMFSPRLNTHHTHTTHHTQHTLMSAVSQCQIIVIHLTLQLFLPVEGISSECRIVRMIHGGIWPRCTACYQIFLQIEASLQINKYKIY